MKPLGTHNYFVYITTNVSKKILYTGVTNNLKVRLYQHKLDAETAKVHFTGKYNCIHLVYWEKFQWIEHAIKREKQIKNMLRIKKERLINDFNLNWRFLNNDLE
jgi:putative endonuclease